MATWRIAIRFHKQHFFVLSVSFVSCLKSPSHVVLTEHAFALHEYFFIYGRSLFRDTSLFSCLEKPSPQSWWHNVLGRSLLSIFFFLEISFIYITEHGFCCVCIFLSLQNLYSQKYLYFFEWRNQVMMTW